MGSQTDPQHTAVLCVECQNGVLGTDAALPTLGADNAALVSQLARLLAGARSAGVRVVHATYEGSLGAAQFGTARIWRALQPVTETWAPGMNPTRVVPELLEATDVVVPRHHGMYPTLDTELIPVLRGFGVTSIVLAGVSLNLALPFTAAHCAQNGFEVAVPGDAVGATPSDYAEQVLRHSVAYIARITTVDELLTVWRGEP